MPIFKYNNYFVEEEELKKIESTQNKFKRKNYVFSDEELQKIKELYMCGYNYKKISEKFNCHKHTIARIIKDKSRI